MFSLRRKAGLKAQRTRLLKQIAVDRAKLVELASILSPFGIRMYLDHIIDAEIRIDDIDRELGEYTS